MGAGLSDAILDAWSKQIHRELSTGVICFREREDRSPTEEAMRWYAAARKKKESARGCSIEHFGVPVSALHAAKAQATYAALAACMVPHDKADDEGRSLASICGESQQRATDAAISNLCGWYVSSAERGQQHMADRLEMSMYKLSRLMGRIEGVMRRRFKARGLVP